MNLYQSIKAKRGQWKRWASVSVATILTGSFLSVSLGFLTIGTTISGVIIAPTAVALAKSKADRKADRLLNKAERQLRKRDRARAKADKHDQKAKDALNKAESTMGGSKGVHDRHGDPGCNQPGVQC